MGSTEADQTGTDQRLGPASQTEETEHSQQSISTRPRAQITVKRRMATNYDASSSGSTPAKQHISDNEQMEESHEEINDEGFTLVEHRRKRKTGIPVLFTPTKEEDRLQQLNPLKLSDEIKATAGAPFVRHRFTAKGGLLVDVAEPATVNRLLTVRALGGVSVVATIPRAYMQNSGLIKGVPDWYSNAEMTDFLGPVGVIAARRLYQRQGQPGEAAKSTDRVVITFRHNTERPAKVNLGFTRHEVIDYVEAPPRCFNCQALGHVSKYCKTATKCKRCSGPHNIKDCSSETQAKCANCGGDHPADYTNCRTRLQALAKKKNFVWGPKIINSDDSSTSEPDPTPSNAACQEEFPAERHVSQRTPKYKAKKKTTHTAGAKSQPNNTSSGEDNSAAPSYDKKPSTPRVVVSSSRATGRRSYSDIVTETKPPKGALTIGDIVSLIFSFLPNFIVSLPPGNFKTVLQGIMVLKPAFIEMTRSVQQSHG